MKEIVIVDGVRTPMGRSKGGAFRFVRAEDLSAKLMQALLERNPEIAPQEIEDVYWGCVQQTLEQGFNIARNASLLAGLPKSIGGITVNRLCGSSMQALHDAVRALACGDGDIMLVGGVEHMGHVPMTHGLDFHPLMAKHVARASGMMGMTAEMLARKYKITRKQQDEFALRSHQAAYQATIQGRFQQEIVPIAGHDSQGVLQTIRTDEVIRAETSIAQLEALKPAFDPVSGSVTAGSSSAISDGAAALLVMTAEKARSLGVRAKVKIKSMAGSGCDPAIMGIGPVHATKKALERAKLNMSNIDLVEINEAFAAQSIPCLQELELYDFIDSKVNLNGGAIALGHPLGCSGARLTTTLMHLMQAKDATLGLATMCIGLGQGIATIFERV